MCSDKGDEGGGIVNIVGMVRGNTCSSQNAQINAASFCETCVSYVEERFVEQERGGYMDMWVFGLVHTCSCEYDQIKEEGYSIT